jgi:hypothetical protein
MELPGLFLSLSSEYPAWIILRVVNDFKGEIGLRSEVPTPAEIGCLPKEVPLLK